MMKKFVHKILPCEAMWHEDKKTIVTMVQVNLFNETIIRPVKDILSSQDREEVIEKDWISNAWKEYEEFWTTNGYEEFREIIEKHAPKLKKITKKEVWDFFRNNWYNPTIQWNTYWFLKEHNLLS